MIMSLKCQLCSLDFKNDGQYQQHLDGKKHKKFESIKESRLDKAERSLFVSGINKHLFVKHIQDHFAQFGKVSKVIIDESKYSYAIVEFETKENMSKALEHGETHKINEKNVKVKPRETKEFVPRTNTNIDKKKEALEKLKEEALVVNTLLGKCQSFDDQVNKLVEHLKLEDEKLEQRQAICNDLINIFKKYWPENEFQVKIFGSNANGLACKGSDMDMSLLINDYMIKNRDRQLVLPKVIVRQNQSNQSKGNGSNDGSSADSPTAYTAATPQSHFTEDIDLDANELGEHNSNNSNESSTNDDEQAKSRQLLKENLKEFFSENVYTKLIDYEVENQIKIVAKIIQRFMTTEIKTLQTITNTRCPIVKFFHTKSQIYCDLSMNNYLAVENTRLLNTYFDLEPNLRKLVFTIRYWMKQKNLYSSTRFNSYTIIWLIIFFMQKSKAVDSLPTVEQLSKMVNGEPVKIHGWNVSFESDVTKIRESTRSSTQKSENSSFNNLLKGFFQFYAQFGFFGSTSTRVLVTRDATIIDDIELTSLSKRNEFINVQDPFDLSHNLTANISKNTVSRFLAECKASNELLSFTSELKKSETKCWGLILLMTRKALPIMPTGCITRMPLVAAAKLLDNQDDKKSMSTMVEIEESMRRAVAFIMYLFKDCLLFEQVDESAVIKMRGKRPTSALKHICDKVDTIELNSSPKRFKLTADNETGSSVTCLALDGNNNKNGAESNEKFVQIVHMCAKQNTWQGRRNLRRELIKKDQEHKQSASTDMDMDMDIEKQISHKLVEKSSNSDHTNAYEPIHFTIRFSMVNGNEKVGRHLKMKFDLLDVHDEASSADALVRFTTFVHFLDTYVGNCHAKYFDKWLTTVREPQLTTTTTTTK